MRAYTGHIYRAPTAAERAEAERIAREKAEDAAYRDEAARTCPMCGGRGSLLGFHGRSAALRCRGCGWTFSAAKQGITPTTEESA